MNKRMDRGTLLTRLVMLAGVCLVAAPISGALAQDKPKPVVKTAREEIKAFCGNIADAARDQRYLLQKEELVKLQGQVDERIALLEERKAEYEDWLKRRNDFLKQAEAGMAVAEICRKGGFSDATFYKWRAKFGGMEVSEAKRLRELEAENAKLKGILDKRFARAQLPDGKLGELVDLISTIGFGESAATARDVLGQVYEYFLGMFASAEGKRGGQFYTPRSIVKTLVAVLAPRQPTNTKQVLGTEFKLTGTSG